MCSITQQAYVSNMPEVIPAKGKKRELRTNLLKQRRLIEDTVGTANTNVSGASPAS